MVGELSWVRHLGEGEVLYRPGEPGNALFIINRGEVEVLTGTNDLEPIRLARGQVIGDVETLSESPRTHLVRAPAGASLQCFPRSNFQPLMRAVPSFFRYLCEQMACRVLQVSDDARNNEEVVPLTGHISNFDLTTVHQTIAHSGQTGQLRIKDEEAEMVGIFYFKSGRPCTAQFQHLTGEEAFWQLFLNENLSGTFCFSVGEVPATNWIHGGEIVRQTDDMLIAALQYRDELNALKQEINPAATARLVPAHSKLHWNNGASEELRPVADRVWELVSRKPLSLSQIYRQCAVCELKIYQVVDVPLKQNQAGFV